MTYLGLIYITIVWALTRGLTVNWNKPDVYQPVKLPVYAWLLLLGILCVSYLGTIWMIVLIGFLIWGFSVDGFRYKKPSKWPKWLNWLKFLNKKI